MQILVQRQRLLRSLVAGFVVASTIAVVLVGQSLPADAATATTITTSYGFTNSVQHFTVPAGVTSLTINALAGQGGWGGADASGNPPPGGYQGEVTGTISVTPGQYLTIAVGSGADEPWSVACTTGQDSSSPTDSHDAWGGINPLSGYGGGRGGAPGSQGCSGYGGAGGAATVIEVGSSASSPTDIGTIVAGGGGGDGGSGQYLLVRGQIGLANFVTPATPTTITYGIPAGCTTACTSHNTIYSPSPLPSGPNQGQDGTAVFTMCGGGGANVYFYTGATSCDGGGGAGGGGGASGGGAGSVQFGSGSSNEWYGQGGSPGQNAVGGFTGLSGLYSYYSDTNTGRPSSSNTFADPGAQFDGSVTLSYASGVPAAPTGVAGTPGNAGAALQWTPPANTGAAAISDYVVQYSSNGGSSWTSVDTGSTATSANVAGLANGTAYIFEVEAVNSIGSGPWSAPSGTVTPSGPPGAPTVTSVASQDGALQVGFTPPASVAPITGYLYQLDGTGPWVAASGTTSPLTIAGLSDGTPYSLQIEAVNVAGAGPASNSMSGTPAALPGAPTITSVQVGPGTASVAFTPGNSGGTAITGYRYSLNGGTTWTAAAGPSPLTITGLAAGTNYAFQLEAINSTGNGAPAAVGFTTPSAPAAPAISFVQSEDQALQVQFPAPASGGYPITDYQWSTDAGTTWTSEAANGTPCVTSTGGSNVTCVVAPLTNGTAYNLEMRAVNAVGAGAASTPATATPATTPAAPTITTGSAGMIPANQTLTVSFNAPGDTGGSPITSYQYSTDAGATWHDRTDGQTTVSPITISALSTDGTTPLTNGATYDVELRAVNAAGDGPGSNVAAGIPATAPSAPSISSVAGQNGGLAVTFTPGSNGGSTVTSYQYSVDGVTWTPTGSLSPTFTISGLTNGTSYLVQIEAVNAVGTSPASAPVAGTPAGAPAQPTITSTSRGDGSISVSFSPPSDGGSPITSYQYSTDSGTTWWNTGTNSSPIAITALSTDGTTAVANGTQYPVEIRAVNAQGTSAASAPVQVAPATVPAAPAVVLATGNGTITVTANISDDGGAPVTALDYSLDGAPFVSAGTTSSSFTISGLSNGTAYTVAVRADNAIGNGTPSSPLSATPSTVPAVPTGVVATADSASAHLSWSAPLSDGGSAILNYTATAYTSAAGTTAAGTPCVSTGLSCTVTGLTNGTTYYVGVVATNANGSSMVSNPLQAVTPLARPSAPTITAITPGNTFLSVAFSAGSPGGMPITSYQYSLDGGTTWTAAVGTTSPLVISGLANGTAYSVALLAVNGIGAGAPSGTVIATPANYPDPVNAATIFANGENGQAVISWTVPNNEGSPITQAQATAFTLVSSGTQAASCTTTSNLSTGSTASCTITGLTNGTTYYVSIQSQNAAGWSSRSTPRVAVIPSINPGAVPNVVATAGNGQATLTWGIGSQGASAITDYTVWYSSGGAYTQFADGVSTATSATVTGLTNGTTYTFEVYAVNSNGTGPASAPSNSVTPDVPVTVTSGPFGGGEVGLVYDQLPVSSGGTGAITWTVSAGSLPPGLSINAATGEVTGTPTSSGTYAFTIKAADAYTAAATQAQSVTIIGAPAITSLPVAGGEVGVAYDARPSVGSGVGPFAWTITSGTLPAGLSLNPSTGEITGTPTTPGTSSFTLVTTDANSQTASQPESVTIAADPTITSPALPGGEVGVSYDTTPAVTAGVGAYTWTITAGTLPAGLALNSSTGAITGTPTAAGTSVFTLAVTDANAQTASQAESITIAADPSITSLPLLGGEVGVAYLAQPAAAGGVGAYTWSVTVGALPSGLTIDSSTGEVFGTPTTAGSYSFDLTVSDSGLQSMSQPETIIVLGGPSVSSPPMAGGEVGVAYDLVPTVSGGTGPYIWSLSGGLLPAGLSLNSSTGEIRGTPTTTGTSVFALVVTDARAQTGYQVESVTIAADPSISSPALAGGEVGVSYDAVPAVAYGVGPFTWSITGGSLPAGLALNSSTGQITGTPTAAGTSTFTVVVTDGNTKSATQAESVTIAAGPSISSPALAGGEVAVAYDAVPAVAHGTGPYTWSITGGSLPAGLSLNTSTGAITGTPTTAGTSTFTLVTIDANAQTASQTESVIIAADPSISSAALAGGEIGAAYDVVPTVSGGTGPYDWSLSGGLLPAGLSLNISTGEISGTPSATGTSFFALVVTDARAQTGFQVESMTIAADPTITSPALPGGEVGVSYDAAPAVQLGVGPFAWSITGGTLPAGLALNSSTGEITGTPSTPGTIVFTLAVTDTNGQTGSQPQSVTIAADPMITSPALPGGEVGVTYNTTPAASAGAGAYTWTITAGTLPTGLSLNSSTGAITGTPTTAGTSLFDLVSTDANAQTASQAESITIAADPTIASPALPGGEAGVTYNTTPSMTGGTWPYIWTITAGTLPAGLILDPSSGQITGTPTTPGTSSFTLVTTDANSQTASQPESVTIAADPTITSPALPGGEVGVSYDTTPAVTAGVGAYTWTITAGTLPSGLALHSSTGAITGTPTTPGTSVFTLVVADGNGKSAAQPESVKINASLSMSVNLGNGTAGMDYDAKPVVSGGTGPYVWTVTAGSLPTWLHLNGSTGELSGTPSTEGTFSFTLVVTDAEGQTASQSLSCKIASVETGGDVAATPNGDGYWTLGTTGGLSVHGSAVSYGTAPANPTHPVVAIAANSQGTGYWETTGRGDVLSFGRTGYFGGATGINLDLPVVGIARTPDDRGYWLAASDGGVFAYGDARFYGSIGGTKLNKQVVGIVPTPDGRGYWLVAADGGVFTFGDARFWGSLGSTKLNQPIVAMATTPDGRGYWLAAADGGVFTFGDARFYGSASDTGVRISGIIARADTGYRLISPDGKAYNFGTV